MSPLEWVMAILPPAVLIAWLLAKWIVWKRNGPTWHYSEIGVRWMPGATKMHNEIGKALSHFLAEDKAPRKFWVVIHPERAVLRSELAPFGTTLSGEPLDGTIDSTRLFPWTEIIPVVIVRQTKSDPSGARTMLHEIAQHLVPEAADQGVNRQHRIAWADKLERRLKEAFNG